jgi:hypothetical protein
MIAEQNYGAHSAQVEMRLIVNGTSIGITHMGRDFVVVESPAEYPSGDASILLKVDESENQWNVRLPDGISSGSKRVTISLATDGAPPSP